ncbi:MAG TPA: NADH-quinone oxidoreductase subunit A [Thermoanaerobaculia bacterium]|nr:NADH-quinone oxidoreductase subunit A [Thermoanaerobaculia bacterium]
MTYSFVPILLMLLVAVVLGAVLLGLNTVLGKKQRNPAKLAPYESGVPLLDESRKRVNVRFYQIAMLFILFDIEAAFLFPWAVIYRDATVTSTGLAWFVFFEMLLFVLLLGVGYVYVWKKKAFDWT